MKQFNPFAKVDSSRGAPMGRRSGNPANLAAAKRLHARRQGGGEGYDRGGAYWGLPSNVWGVWARIDGEIECIYIRAWTRDAAIAGVRGEKC